MERLTERTSIGVLVKEDYGEKALKTLYSCNGGKPNPHYTNCDEGYCAMEKLAAYEDAEEQGLLLRLPCKVGDMIYCIEDKQVWCCTIEKISISKNNGTWIEISFPEEMPDLVSMEFYPNEIGKTVFLTREEAKAKLKEMEGSHDGE